MYQSLVDFKYWTFIAQICNLLIQMLLFKKFLFKPVKAIIEKRREEVGTLYTEAEEANASARHDKAEYSQKLLAANEEAAQIVRNATERAGRQGDEILQQAQHQAQSMLEAGAPPRSSCHERDQERYLLHGAGYRAEGRRKRDKARGSQGPYRRVHRLCG